MPTLRVLIDARGAVAGAATYSTASKKIVADSTASATAIARADTAMLGLGRTAQNTATQVGGLVARFAGIVGIALAVRSMARFEETMAIVQGVTRASADEMERLTGVAQELGATTRFTASQAGEGILALSRAGFTASESAEAMRATLNLAVAAVIDLGEASEITANNVRTFGLAAAEATRVSDVFTATANRSNTTVQQLAQAMKLAGPIARVTSQDIETAAAAIGVLGNSGLQATLAGTGLRGILLALAKPTKQARDAIEDLGLSLDEVDPTTQSIVDVFRAFGKVNLDAASATAIFRRQQAGAAIILANNVDVLEKLVEANRNSAGEAQRLADIQNQTLAGSFRSLLSATEALALALGEAGLIDAIKGVIDFTTAVVRELAGVETQGQETAESVKLVAEAIQFTTKVVGALIALKVAGTLARWTLQIRALTTAMLAANVAMRANPIGLLITGAAAATIAVIELTDAIFSQGEALSAQEEQVVKLAASYDEINRAAADALRDGTVPQQIDALTAKLELFEKEFVRVNDVVRQQGAFTDLPSGQFEALNLRVETDEEGFVDAIDAQQALLDVMTRLRRMIDDIETSEARREERQRMLAEQAKKRAEEERRLNEFLEAQRERMEELRRAAQEREVAEFDRRKEARASIDQQIRAIDREIALTLAQGDAKTRLATEFRILEAAQQAGIELNERQRSSLDRLIERLVLANRRVKERDEAERQAAQRDQTIEAIEQENRALEQQIMLLDLEGQARIDSIVAFELENAQRELGSSLTEEQAQKLRELIETRERLKQTLESRSEAQDELKRVGDSAQEAGRAIRSAESSMQSFVEQVVTGSSEGSAALEQLVRQLSRIALQLASQNLFGNIGSLFSGGGGSSGSSPPSLLENTNFEPAAQGLAMGGGRVYPMAHGDVLFSQRFFPLRGGGRVQAGEAGEEGLFPLSRDRFGRLAVHATGGGGGTTNININVGGRAMERGQRRRTTAQIVRAVEKGMRRSRLGIP